MTRLEENMTTINEINNLFEETTHMPLNSEEMIAFQISLISTTLIDISKSLAVIADNKENENERV
jgi:hypothetical protein